MKVIGLTGGIATGKSTVSSILSELGYKIVDADKIAREVVENGKPAYEDIIERFGKTVTNEDGTLNRRRLADLVFNDRKCLEELNAIVHPRVRKSVKEIFESYEKKGEKVIIFDCPLLFEGELENTVDEIWLVYADEAKQLKRIIHRDHLNEIDSMLRIKSQIPIEKKKEKAHVIIDNTETLSELRAKIVKLVKAF